MQARQLSDVLNQTKTILTKRVIMRLLWIKTNWLRQERQLRSTLNQTNLIYFITGDSRVISGESGAVTLGALNHICTTEPQIRDQLEITEDSRILLISTEGDTDPEGFQQIVLNK